MALNRTMAITDGAYVWICDDDDLLRPGAVALLFAALDGSDLGFVFGVAGVTGVAKLLLMRLMLPRDLLMPGDPLRP